MNLVKYDLSGIQKYIFSTNKMKEIEGASIIVHQVLYKHLQDCIWNVNHENQQNEQIPDQYYEEWKKDTFKDTFEDKVKAKVVYIGGGNALVLFNDDTAEKEVTLNLKKKTFLETGGGLSIYSAGIKIDKDEKLKYHIDEINKKMIRAKMEQMPMKTAPGISITADEDETKEPLLIYTDDHYYAASNTYHKLKCTKEQKQSEHNFLARVLPEEMRKDDKKRSLDKDINKHIKKNEKNYLAMIHIDGNTMGQYILKFVKDSEESIIDALDKLRILSIHVSEIYEKTIFDVLKNSISLFTISKNEGEKNPLPKSWFRPLIVDGDDITAVCHSNYGLKFVCDFMKNLSTREMKGSNGNKLNETPLTAAAGIVYTNMKFPFSTAYNVAEECCKNAKRKTLEREEKKNEKDIKASHSSFDFQVMNSGVTTDIMSYRSRYMAYQHENDKVSLSKRPYIFMSDAERMRKEKDSQIFDVKQFVERLEIAKEINRKQRSKLIEMKQAYGRGHYDAKSHADFLMARAEGKTKMDFGKLFAVAGNEEIQQDEKESVKAIVFEKQKEDGQTMYATIYDVLDILDFCMEVELTCDTI